MHVHSPMQLVPELLLQTSWLLVTTIVLSFCSKPMLDLSEMIANPHSLQDGEQLHEFSQSSSPNHPQHPSTNERGFSLSQSNQYDYIPNTLRREITTSRVDGKNIFSFTNNDAYSSKNSKNEQEVIDDGLYEN